MATARVYRFTMIAVTGNPSMPLESTFMALYEAEGRTVLRFARAAAGANADVEEIVAETFARAWKAWPRFSGDGRQARAWLIRIARNAIYDSSRRRHGVRLLPLDEAAPGGGGHESSTVDRVMILAALDHLTRPEREVVAMRAAGLSHAEIGDLTGRTEGASKMTWHRAVERIRPHLERYS